MSGGALLAGHLRLSPGAAEAVRCERPMVGASMMRRLAEGRQAALLPGLLGSVFALAATAQSLTARRAVRAAFGVVDDAERRVTYARMLRLATLAEHLQRLALDLPGAGDPGWLRGAPATPAVTPSGLKDAEDAWPVYLARHLFGTDPTEWLAAWRAQGSEALDRWIDGCEHPLTRGLAAVRERARSLAWPARPLRVLDTPDAGMAELARALHRDLDFAERPTWQGAPAETGACWRQGDVGVTAPTAWARLGARLAEVAALASGDMLSSGARPLGPREGIAWCEMSRGLLVHWARVDRGPEAADRARIEAYRVLAPTEWNFHPAGGFASWLRDAAPAPDDVRLAALALDPCVEVEVDGETAGVSPHA